eukprot:5878872-Amphidinium_carterae.1
MNFNARRAQVFAKAQLTVNSVWARSLFKRVDRHHTLAFIASLNERNWTCARKISLMQKVNLVQLVDCLLVLCPRHRFSMLHRPQGAAKFPAQVV